MKKYLPALLFALISSPLSFAGDLYVNCFVDNQDGDIVGSGVFYQQTAAAAFTWPNSTDSRWNDQFIVTARGTSSDTGTVYQFQVIRIDGRFGGFTTNTYQTDGHTVSFAIHPDLRCSVND